MVISGAGQTLLALRRLFRRESVPLARLLRSFGHLSFGQNRKRTVGAGMGENMWVQIWTDISSHNSA